MRVEVEAVRRGDVRRSARMVGVRNSIVNQSRQYSISSRCKLLKAFGVVLSGEIDCWSQMEA